jgi:catechol 2,3-dioxygenase-like lactoylglutathione lyase family enzyme
MPLGGLQHYTIEPQDLEQTKDFYCEVLGLENGDRPPLDFPGYWLYSGGVATVHLMGTRKPREGIVVRGTKKKYEDTGRLDHIAFAATNVEEVRKRLLAKNVKFRESIVPRTGDTQFSLRSRRRRRGVELPEGIRRTCPRAMRRPAQRWLAVRFVRHVCGEPIPTRS